MAKSAGAFTGGKLNLKGDKRKPKKKSKNTKHGEPSEGDRVAKSSNHNASSGSDDDGYHDDKKKVVGMTATREDLTAAEKRSLKFKLQRERKELEQVVSMSHRERVEQFNEKLGKLTELNDIPRVSAAGNG